MGRVVCGEDGEKGESCTNPEENRETCRQAASAMRCQSLGRKAEMEQEERRRMPRVPFVASAELLEVDTGTRMNAQVSELSLHGCYVDTLNPLPKGTSVFVKIFTEEYFFESPAIVVYCHPRLGMGLAFHDVKPHFVNVLQNWVMASAGKKDLGG
jgi:hypothetical protein